MNDRDDAPHVTVPSEEPRSTLDPQPPSPTNRLGLVLAWIAIAVLVALVLVVVFAVRAVAAPTYPTEACAVALPGSAVEEAYASLHVPLVCERKPSWAPPVAGAAWDGQTVHLWTADGADPRLTRKLAAHELGHAVAAYWPALLAEWEEMRGSSGTAGSEDFAEGFYFSCYPEAGMSWVLYGGLSKWTDAEMATMRAWFVGASRPWVAVGGKAPAVVQARAFPTFI